MIDERDPLIRAAIVELGIASREAPSWAELEAAAAAGVPIRRAVPRNWAVAVAVAVAVLLLIGVPAWFFGTRQGPIIDDPSTTTTLAPTTVPPTVPPPPAPVQTWGRVGTAVMQPVVGLFAMTETESGLVAVGFDPGEEDFRQNGVIFTSDDGLTWTRLAEDDPALNLGAILIYGVAEGGPGLVAVGMGCEDDTEPCAAHPTVWTSADGTAWSRTPADPEVFAESGAMFDVIATDDGVVVVGGIVDVVSEEEFYLRPAVWHSTDATTWARVWEGDRVGVTPMNPGIKAVALSPDGLLVAVGSAEDSSGAPVAAVWTSPDGIAWERVDLDAAAFRGSSDAGTVILDVSWNGGFVAVGTDGGVDPALWRSEDGRSWELIEMTGETFAGTGTISSVAALGSGFVAAGPHGFADQSGGGYVQLWTSPDGVTWDRVLVIGQGYAMSVIATEELIVVAGGLPEDNDFHAGVWTGAAFDPSDPPPDPGAPPPLPVEEESGVGALEAGLSCTDLAAGGLTYAETVAYWGLHDLPEDLDSDGTGIPCTAAFPEADVVDVFGAAGALDFHIFSNIDDRTFLADGPAVDAGLVCDTGTTDFAGGDEGRPGSLWRWEDEFTCDDGSGTFILGADVFVVIESEGREFGVWDVVSGTGAYEQLRGGGRSLSSPTEVVSWADELTGYLWISE